MEAFAESFDRTVLQEYKPLQRIGRGLYGIVWQAKSHDAIEGSKYVAIKRIYNAFANKVDAKRTYREIMYMLHLSEHPNVVTLHDVLPSKNDLDLYLVMEEMDTDLSQVINSGLQPIHIQFITWQLLRALKYIHSANVVHRDLKPQNILINSKCSIRICDFGLARSSTAHEIDIYGPLPEKDPLIFANNAAAIYAAGSSEDRERGVCDITNYCSSRWYRSPEQLVNALNYSTSIDVWALGCVVGEMIQRKPIFPGSCTLSQLTLIVHITGRPSDADLKSIDSSHVIPILEGLGKSKEGDLKEVMTHGNEEVHDFVRLCLQFNPEKRITASEALEHPFVGNFHHPDAEGVHSSSTNGGIALSLNDQVQYRVSAYRDRIYADVLGNTRLGKKINKERKIKMELLWGNNHDKVSSTSTT